MHLYEANTAMRSDRPIQTFQHIRYDQHALEKLDPSNNISTISYFHFSANLAPVSILVFYQKSQK